MKKEDCEKQINALNSEINQICKEPSRTKEEDLQLHNELKKAELKLEIKELKEGIKETDNKEIKGELKSNLGKAKNKLKNLNKTDCSNEEPGLRY